LAASTSWTTSLENQNNDVFEHVRSVNVPINTHEGAGDERGSEEHPTASGLTADRDSELHRTTNLPDRGRL